MRYLSERQAWLRIADEGSSNGFWCGLCFEIRCLRASRRISAVTAVSMKARIARKKKLVSKEYAGHCFRPSWLRCGYCWPTGAKVRIRFCRQVAARLKPKKKA